MSRRIDRVNDLLRDEISQLLVRQIKDPRLNGVITITSVNTSSDLRSAQVFLSVMGDDSAKKLALEGIRSAATYLRRELRPRLALRHTPFLTFALDQSIEQGDHLLGLMDRIRISQTDPASPSESGQHFGSSTLPSSGS